MHGDRRPYPVMLVTLDEEEIVPWAEQQGIEDTSIPALAKHPKVLELIQGELDRANAKYAQVEQVKRFFDPRPRPLAGDGRADADAEGQAQRRQREVRGPLRRAVRRRLAHRDSGGPHAASIGRRADRPDRHRRAVRRPPPGYRARPVPRPARGVLARAPARRRPPRPRDPRRDDRGQPPVLGADPGGLAVGRLAGRVPDRQRELRDPHRVRGPARGALRGARRCSSASTTSGSSSAAPQGSTSARASSGRSSA